MKPRSKIAVLVGEIIAAVKCHKAKQAGISGLLTYTKALG
jgi:hypothetical protein